MQHEGKYMKSKYLTKSLYILFVLRLYLIFFGTNFAISMKTVAELHMLFLQAHGYLS